MSRDSRGVPPTPPSGLPRVDLPGAPSDATGEDEGTPRQRRPEAPPWSFAPATDGKALASKTTTTCPVCESDNPINYRFCALCGGKLQAGPPPGPASAPSAMDSINPRILASPPPPSGAARAKLPSSPESRTPDEVATVALEAIGESSASNNKIVGAPVVEIAPNEAKPEPTHSCWRCAGVNAAGARFCKYCGAPLEKGVVSERPAWSPPAEPASDVPPPVKTPSPQIPRPAPVHTAGLGAAPAGPPSQRPTIEGAPPPSLVGPPASVAPVTIPKPRPAPPPVPNRAEAGVARAGASGGAAAPRGEMGDKPQGPAARSAPSPAAAGRLVVIVEDGSEGRSFALTGAQVDIGRTEGDILLYHDQYVSPRHARLIWSDNHWKLRDLGSVNRVYVRIRRPTPLRDGDLLLLGLEVLQFQTVSDAERGLGPATQHGTLLFGSPASPRRARLNQRTVEGVTRDVFHLFRDETVIGREVGDIVFTADPFLSRRHAAIRRTAGGDTAQSGAQATSDLFSLVDLESSNGTYVAIREDVPLEHGDFIRIGQHLFRLDFTASRSPTPGEADPSHGSTV